VSLLRHVTECPQYRAFHCGRLLNAVNRFCFANDLFAEFFYEYLRTGAGEHGNKNATLGVNTPATVLSNEEILRYSRHLIMPEVGMDGQLKLKNARVLLIGTGGLGAPLGLYLAAAGVGKLGLVDFDVVDFTNLQRQVTFGTTDVGKHKSEAARARLSNLNPDIEIQSFETQLTSANALELFKDFDIIVDGTDNFPTRYLVNDACILLGKPNVYGSIFRFEARPRFSACRMARATGAYIPNRLRRGLCLPAPRAECLVCSRELSARFRRWKRSS